MKSLMTHPDITRALGAGAVVSYSVSGGKDSDALVLAAHAGMGLPFWLGLGWACAGEVGASAMAGFLILNGLRAWRRTRRAQRERKREGA